MIDIKKTQKELGWDSYEGKLFAGPLFLELPERINKAAALGVKTIYYPDNEFSTRGIPKSELLKAGISIKPARELKEKWIKDNPALAEKLKKEFKTHEVLPLALISEMKHEKIAFCCGLGVRSLGTLWEVRRILKANKPVTAKVPRYKRFFKKMLFHLRSRKNK